MVSMISGFSNNNKLMLSAPVRERPVKIEDGEGVSHFIHIGRSSSFFLVQELNSRGVRYPDHNDWI